MFQKARLFIQREGGLWKTFRKYGFLRIILRIIDYGITLVFKTLVGNFYRPSNSEFGLVDALLCPKDVNWWTRHTAVANYIRSWDCYSILDVGAGTELGIVPFLKRKKYSICLFDKDLPPRTTKEREGITFVRGDACKLPFKTKSFDVVCSVAVLPQIPKEHRQQFFQELKRVGKRVCLFSHVVEDHEGFFKGLEWDINLRRDVLREGKDSYSLERVSEYLVQLEEIKSFAKVVIGCQNYDITYKYVSLSCRPIIGFFTGLLYYFAYKRKDNKPPYRAVVAIVDDSADTA